jgi:hypothetical protein
VEFHIRSASDLRLYTSGCDTNREGVPFEDGYESTSFNCDPILVEFAVSLDAGCCGDLDTTLLYLTSS